MSTIEEEENPVGVEGDGASTEAESASTDDADAPREVEAEPDDPNRIATGRWGVGVTAALVAGGLGMVVGNPAILLSSVVGLTYAAYGYATRPPSMAVVVDREVSDGTPLPGAAVAVRVTVENAGGRALPDLRVSDRVPDSLEVVEGAPATGTTLEPGETVAVEYTVRARRGDHVLGPTTVASRNLSGSEERRREVTNAVDLSVDAGPRSVPLREATVPHTGRVDTDAGGDGVEFYATRQYHPNDPMRRIDWNRFARTGELTTVEYREQRAAVVVVLVDVRREAEVARGPGDPDGVELGEYAAERLVESLLDDNNRVGVALYGDGSYLLPGTGRAHSLRTRRLLREGTSELLDDPRFVRAAIRSGHVEWILDRIPPEAQVVVVSPLVDDDVADAAIRLDAHGHDVSVLSPDLTTTDTPGATVARIERAHRIHALREDGVPTLEWTPDEPLYNATKRAERRWST